MNESQDRNCLLVGVSCVKNHLGIGSVAAHTPFHISKGSDDSINDKGNLRVIRDILASFVTQSKGKFMHTTATDIESKKTNK